MTAILLAAAIEAARQFGGDSVAVLLFQITELGGKVIFGTVIIVVGLFLARILAAWSAARPAKAATPRPSSNMRSSLCSPRSA